MKLIRNVYDWMGKKAHSRHGLVWLCILFFIESSFFIIPVDPLLILFCVEHRKRAFFFATLATISSVVGGIFGYMIGYLLWDSVGVRLVNLFISQETFQVAVHRYTLYQAWAVLIGALTPVPYKAITISAGFCKLPLIPFFVYSIIGRGARFYLLAGAIYVWGVHIKEFIDKYFNYLVVAFTLIVILSCLALKG
jgi:membrane protein YqaA with SNARE-associated domain